MKYTTVPLPVDLSSITHQKTRPQTMMHGPQSSLSLDQPQPHASLDSIPRMPLSQHKDPVLSPSRTQPFQSSTIASDGMLPLNANVVTDLRVFRSPIISPSTKSFTLQMMIPA